MIYYSGDKIRSLNCIFNIIIGERSNGKSFDFKTFALTDLIFDKMMKEMSICQFVNNKKLFILLRRFVEEIKNDKMSKYFEDIDIVKLTKGKYNTITPYRGAFYFANFDIENFKTIRGEKIGYYMALSTEQNYAGSSFLDVDKIIFEEFMSRSSYLYNEPKKLMNLYSTIDRKRRIVKLFMLGNTISKVCPYFKEWNLLPIINQMKQGDIQVVQVQGIDVAIEYCQSLNRSSGVIGSVAKMINTGAWDTTPQPQLKDSLKNYKKIYSIGFEFKGFKFLGDLLQKDKLLIWFVKPYNGDFKDNMIVISDVIKEQKNYQTNIYNIKIKNEKIKKLLKTFTKEKIFYSSDLCGSDFKQVINFEIGD